TKIRVHGKLGQHSNFFAFLQRWCTTFVWRVKRRGTTNPGSKYLTYAPLLASRKRGTLAVATMHTEHVAFALDAVNSGNPRAVISTHNRKPPFTDLAAIRLAIRWRQVALSRTIPRWMRKVQVERVRRAVLEFVNGPHKVGKLLGVLPCKCAAWRAINVDALAIQSISVETVPANKRPGAVISGGFESIVRDLGAVPGRHQPDGQHK
ncbi:hypothetical protein B0T26DRAFT_211324, partial [Lasiosphaeria miniovina]